MMAQLSPDGVVSAPVRPISCYSVVLLNPFSPPTAPVISHSRSTLLDLGSDLTNTLHDQKTCTLLLPQEIFQDNNGGEPDGKRGVQAGVNLEQAERSGSSSSPAQYPACKHSVFGEKRLDDVRASFSQIGENILEPFYFGTNTLNTILLLAW